MRLFAALWLPGMAIWAERSPKALRASVNRTSVGRRIARPMSWPSSIVMSNDSNPAEVPTDLSSAGSRLLQLAAAEDGPDGFHHAVADAVEVLVQVIALVGVADVEEEAVARPGIRRGGGQIEGAVLG